MEVILYPAGEYLLYENSDADDLLSYLIPNGDFIYTILIQFAPNLKRVRMKPNYIRKL